MTTSDSPKLAALFIDRITFVGDQAHGVGKIRLLREEVCVAEFVFLLDGIFEWEAPICYKQKETPKL